MLGLSWLHRWVCGKKRCDAQGCNRARAGICRHREMFSRWCQLSREEDGGNLRVKGLPLGYKVLAGIEGRSNEECKSTLLNGRYPLLFWLS